MLVSLHSGNVINIYEWLGGLSSRFWSGIADINRLPVLGVVVVVIACGERDVCSSVSRSVISTWCHGLSLTSIIITDPTH